jgi:hypothetical protein
VCTASAAQWQYSGVHASRSGCRLGLFNPAAVYDHLGSIIATSNVLSLAICALLVLKVSALLRRLYANLGQAPQPWALSVLVLLLDAWGLSLGGPPLGVQLKHADLLHLRGQGAWGRALPHDDTVPAAL